ncbi:hypothetical protein WMY93_001175 [Mugilogobius chulae]|uniref:LRRCT domain-containing protein n=1 Tax=Mugilogobius chulae TaxID=88201 RepID=A0AAW0QC15_9GOBI
MGQMLPHQNVASALTQYDQHLPDAVTVVQSPKCVLFPIMPCFIRSTDDSGPAVTEGSISTVQPGALSELSNVTVISLSHNQISALDQNSFRNMPLLQTLLLDHNLLTLRALEGGALTNLTRLEVLALGNNLIDRINSNLFKDTNSLRILKLEGNQISRLDSGSFPLTGLRVLESLDLSDNFINYLDKNSFRGLISLTTLDLSRNSLQSAPYEAFSYLTWLNNLNLDLNTWNCSCQLLELADFLSAFIQEPDKTLYNGRRLVCVSADNPAVTTVLELTEANCVPSNQNITVRVDTRGSITPQLYIRDLAITGAVCFTGEKTAPDIYNYAACSNFT